MLSPQQMVSEPMGGGVRQGGKVMKVRVYEVNA